MIDDIDDCYFTVTVWDNAFSRNKKEHPPMEITAITMNGIFPPTETLPQYCDTPVKMNIRNMTPPNAITRNTNVQANHQEKQNSHIRSVPMQMTSPKEQGPTEKKIPKQQGPGLKSLTYEQKNGEPKHGTLCRIGHQNKWMRTWSFFQKWRWNGMLNLDNFFPWAGCLAVCVVDRQLYGYDRCSVL
jgi:hypothetical protein